MYVKVEFSASPGDKLVISMCALVFLSSVSTLAFSRPFFGIPVLATGFFGIVYFMGQYDLLGNWLCASMQDLNNKNSLDDQDIEFTSPSDFFPGDFASDENQLLDGKLTQTTDTQPDSKLPGTSTENTSTESDGHDQLPEAPEAPEAPKAPEENTGSESNCQDQVSETPVNHVGTQPDETQSGETQLPDAQSDERNGGQPDCNQLPENSGDKTGAHTGQNQEPENPIDQTSTQPDAQDNCHQIPADQTDAQPDHQSQLPENPTEHEVLGEHHDAGVASPSGCHDQLAEQISEVIQTMKADCAVSGCCP